VNPVITGALIGAIPGTLAAGLTMWAAIHSNRFNLRQTSLILEAEHDRWLREKRADVYVDILQYARGAEVRRISLQTSLTDPLKRTNIINEGRERYWAPETQTIIARANAYASPQVANAFGRVWDSDQEVWAFAENSFIKESLILESERLANAYDRWPYESETPTLKDETPTLEEQLTEKMELALKEETELRDMIAIELQMRTLPMVVADERRKPSYRALYELRRGLVSPWFMAMRRR
jgi:hypothetical protein